MPKSPKEDKGHPKCQGKYDKEAKTFKEVIEASDKEPKICTTLWYSKALLLPCIFVSWKWVHPFFAVIVTKADAQWKTIQEGPACFSAKLVWFNESIIYLNNQTRKILNTFLIRSCPLDTESEECSCIELFNLIGFSPHHMRTMNGTDLLALCEGSTHPKAQILTC